MTAFLMLVSFLCFLQTVASASTTLASVPSQSSGTSTPASSSTRQQNKAAIIVVSIIAALIFLAVLAILVFLILRRRRSETKRWTFHRDMMVQRCQQSPPVSPGGSDSATINSHSQDLEQGVHHTLPPPVPPKELPTPDPGPRIPDPVIYPYRMAGPSERRPTIRRLDLDASTTPRSPMGPRPPLFHVVLTPNSALRRSARPMSPIPRSPSPRTHRQRAIADQIEILRMQMLELERNGVKDHIGMNEMSEKMAWLREQQEGSWALGLTEVTPLGYDRCMT